MRWGRDKFLVRTCLSKVLTTPAPRRNENLGLPIVALNWILTSKRCLSNHTLLPFLYFLAVHRFQPIRVKIPTCQIESGRLWMAHSPQTIGGCENLRHSIRWEFTTSHPPMALFDDRNNKSWQVTRCYASNLLNTSLTIMTTTTETNRMPAHLRAPMTYCGELIYKVHIIVFPATVGMYIVVAELNFTYLLRSRIYQIWCASYLIMSIKQASPGRHTSRSADEVTKTD